MNFLYLAIITCFVSAHGWHHNKKPPQKLHTFFEWKMLEFNFPTEADEQQASASGNLIPTNGIPIDVQPHYNDYDELRTFVTIPKFQAGVPYTLAIVSEKLGKNGPLLEPYPSYEAHNINGTYCDGITSAFRVAINECNQMWVIDSGMVGGDAQCAPQLLLFDLNTDKLIHRYRFNTSLYTPGISLFINPVAVVKDPFPSCRHTMVYVADVNNHGLVVYNYAEGNAWRIDNLRMYPNPDYGLQTLAGENFILMDGIFGMATDKENLYFHPFASITEYAVPLRVVDNRTLFENDSGNSLESFRAVSTRCSACTVSAMDSQNNLYCVSMDPIRLVVWDAKKEVGVEIPVDPKTFQFVSGMKILNEYNREVLWVLSNRYQKAATGTQDFSEVNFRIGVIPLPIKSSEMFSPHHFSHY